MTLTTTEELKHLASSDNTNELTRRLARECLANREAQPSITDEAIDRIVVPLSPDGLDEEKHHCEWHLYHDRERIRKELREYFATPPAPANAQIAGYFVRHRSAWDRPSKWSLWTECSAEDYAEFCKIIATGDADAGRFYEARILYDAPPAPAVPDKPRLPPHVYRDLLDMLQETAIAYGGTQQLRAQLSSALSIHVQPDHPHTRAAMLKGERP
ncbi:Uncharacterised protein [Serratia marcescens]|uniref:hypothetical protein n=1 Tax=Serratia marcescens TaxID=615 RepID=UPI0007450F6B|nr:hypothetical protein [Serratia marcescens]CVH63867.1 Uncharacterised protein [Serratia marcescens]